MSKKYGLAHGLSLARVPAQGPEVFLFKLAQNNLGELGGVNSFSAACSAELSESLFSACGESLERYCGFLRDESRCLFGSYREISRAHDAFHPREWPRFDESQYLHPKFGLRRWTETCEIAWIEARSLVTGRTRWLPADSIVHLPRPDTVFVDFPTSSGLACGSTFEMACLNGLLEIIERDAVMHTWWTRRRPDFIAWEELLHREEFHAYRSLRGHVSVLDCTTDLGVPVALAVFQGRNERRTPRLLVAAAAKTDETEAVRKSLAELSHLLIRAQAGFSARMRIEPCADADEVRGFFMALLQYHRDESFSRAAFLLESARRRSPRAGGDGTLAEVVARVHGQGFEPWVIDRTTGDVDSLGFKVVRIVVPGLLPLNAFHLHRPWGVPRLFTLGQKLGTHDRVLGLDDLNPANHPFP